MALDPSLYPALKANILASPDLNSQPNTQDGAYEIARLYNLLASPTFTVWRSRVPYQEVADNTSVADLGNMTAANVSRYSTAMQISPGGIVPTSVRRAGFEDIFGGAAGATTRAKLGLAGTVWMRSATRVEKVYATGTGTVASPASLVYEGAVNYQDVFYARNS